MYDKNGIPKEAVFKNLQTGSLEIRKVSYDGPAMVSTGQRVTEWTAQEQPCKKKKTYNCK